MIGNHAKVLQAQAETQCAQALGQVFQRGLIRQLVFSSKVR